MQKALIQDDVLASVERWREAEWQARQPLLQRFRETSGEQAIRAAEGPIPVVGILEAAATAEIGELARALEMLCGEGLRFERWLDTLPVSETAAYRACRKMLP